MAQQLKEFTDLTENLALVPNTHRAPKFLKLHFQGIKHSPSASMSAHTWYTKSHIGTYIHAHTHMYTK